MGCTLQDFRDESSMQHEGAEDLHLLLQVSYPHCHSLCVLLFYITESLDLPKLDLSLTLTFMFYVLFLFLQYAASLFHYPLRAFPFAPSKLAQAI